MNCIESIYFFNISSHANKQFTSQAFHQKMTIILRNCIYILCFIPMLTWAQFAPRAGEQGSTAIHKDSGIFVAWATEAVLNRGYQNCQDTSLGKTTTGSAESAVGKAGENGLVSLGDGGEIILTFETPIRNGEGFDFAVFENGFFYKDSLDFLELAFVEISSDGENYFRFPSHSLTNTLFQVDTFEGIDARKIHNLAGKYTYGFGTPFDLSEIPEDNRLNKNAIRYVKLIDVVGSLHPAFANYDHNNTIINDPWPTPFPQGGFDLDAVGVIHTTATSITNSEENYSLSIWPNPVNAGSHINFSKDIKTENINLWDAIGTAYPIQIEASGQMKIPDVLSPGLYQVQIAGFSPLRLIIQ